jgi:prolyl-tRNA editing enzyme YbaK/EbsC (Cys-tRNA(Pro) deacylase)
VDERNARVSQALLAAGIEPKITILDADAKTAAAAAAQLGCEVGAIANSLVFDCDGEPLLVMASGAARIDTDVVARHLGVAAITKAAPAMVRAATGQVIGGVAPTGHPAPLRTLVDVALAEYPLLWTAAGTADSVMPLTYAQLVKLTAGQETRVR